MRDKPPKQKDLARAPLPRLVNAVGDRIGLAYGIDRKAATQNYIEKNRDDTRLEFSQLRNSHYSLNESKTRKEGNSKAAKQPKVRNPIKLNSRDRKSLYKLSHEEKQKLEYSTFERVHELWKGYSSFMRRDNHQVPVFRLDLHGCKLRCTASKNPTLVGAQGIVVQETRNTFLIIKPSNRLVTLPKKESLFEFEIDEKIYKIHGCNLLFTTQIRSKVKYKQQKCLSDI